MQLQHLQKSAQLWRCWARVWRFSSSSLDVGADLEMQLQHLQKLAQLCRCWARVWRFSSSSLDVGADLEMQLQHLQKLAQLCRCWASVWRFSSSSLDVGADLEMQLQHLQKLAQLCRCWARVWRFSSSSLDVGAGSPDPLQVPVNPNREARLRRAPWERRRPAGQLTPLFLMVHSGDAGAPRAGAGNPLRRKAGLVRPCSRGRQLARRRGSGKVPRASAARYRSTAF